MAFYLFYSFFFFSKNDVNLSLYILLKCEVISLDYLKFYRTDFYDFVFQIKELGV
jgi:hypothetical protein